MGHHRPVKVLNTFLKIIEPSIFDQLTKQKKIAEAILLDVSKGFDRISHDFLEAKIDVYGFDKEALSLMHHILSLEVMMIAGSSPTTSS